MTTFFYKISFKVGCNKVCSAWNKVVALLLNILYPMFCKFSGELKGVTDKKRDTQIIISFTSFPKRMDKIHLCIETLMRQSVKADRIILWLVKEEFVDYKIPDKVLQLKKRGLEIRYCEENLRPHNKLFYTSLNYPNSIIVTVDDDILYPGYLIEDLFKAYKVGEKSIYCNMAHEITLNSKGVPKCYKEWNGGAIGIKGESDRLVALGVGGVLYPPFCFDKEYYDVEKIKKLSLSADDLWLKFNELRSGYKVFKIAENTKNPITIKSTQEIALTKSNNGEGRNDICMKNLQRFYNINWNDIR